MKSVSLEQMSVAKAAVLAMVCYLVAALLYYLPTLGSFSSALIGPPEDNMQFYWFLWYGSRALTDPNLPLMHSSAIYYPEGMSLYYANYFYYGFLIAFLLKPVLSLAAIFNLLVLHAYIVAGLGAFLLVRDVTKNNTVSLVAGFVYAFNPSHFAHSLHHITIASIQFIPFFVLFTLRAWRDPRKSWIACAAAFWVLSALCDWNYLVYGLVFLALGLVFRWVRSRKMLPMRDLMTTVWIGVGTLLVLAPLIVPMIMQGLARPEVKLPGHDTYVADLTSFFVPHAYHLLSGLSVIKKAYMSYPGTLWESVAYLGLVNLSVIAFAWKRMPRDKWKYLLGLLSFMILALGVCLYIYGKRFDLPMPYKILEALPFLSQARNPSRIIVFAYLFLSILVGLSLKTLFFATPWSVKRKMAFGIIVLLIFLDFYSPAKAVTPVGMPHAYTIIQKDPDKDFGILEIPHEHGRYMFYQTIHGIPNVQGYLGRRMSDALTHRLTFDLKNKKKKKDMLIKNKVKYIVMYKNRIIRDEKKLRTEGYSYEAYDLKVFNIFDSMSKLYSRTYKKIYDDSIVTLFRVY